MKTQQYKLYCIMLFFFSFYHGVFADNSCRIPMVDINSSSVVVLLRCSYGHIWTDPSGWHKVKKKSAHKLMNTHVTVCACECVYKSFHTTVCFQPAIAGETSRYSKTNRQLSVVSGHKTQRDLWESGNKSIKCWSLKQRVLIPLPQRDHVQTFLL